MPFVDGTEIVDKTTNEHFLIIVQDNLSCVLAPQRINGFSKRTDEWIFIYNFDETNYRIDTNNVKPRSVKDFFSYSNEDYKLSGTEFTVLYKCRQRAEYIPDQLISNISLIVPFAEMVGVDKGELVKKIVCITNEHTEYELEVIAQVEDYKNFEDDGIELLGDKGF